MANNPRFSGVQPLQPPIIGSMEPPRSFVPPMSSQFRQVVPAQQPQQFNPVPSQHFYPVGRGVPLMNVGLPPHQTLQPQFSQPMPQLPPRAGQPGHATLPSQAIPLPVAQPNMHIASEKPIPQLNAQNPNNYSPGLGGPERPLTPSYTFAPSSYGQLHINFNAPTQYQSTSQMHPPSISSSRQLNLPSENQSTAPVTSLQHSVEQPLVPTSVAPATSVQPSSTREASTDWIEHTSADGRRYYFNKRTRQSSWEKPLELMTPIERADASTNWKEYTSPDGRKYYYNKVTKESKWSIPEELKLAREQVEKLSVVGTQLETSVNPPASACIPPAVVEAPSGGDTASSAAPGIASSPVSVRPDAPAGEPMLVSVSSASTVIPSSMDENADGVQTLPNVVTPSASVPESAEATVNMACTTQDPMNEVNELSSQDILSSVDGVPVKAAEGADAVNSLEEVKKDETGEKMHDIASEAKPVDPEPLIYANKLEAKNAFKALLESANVGSEWTWDRAMRVIINDRRYGALKTLGERKQVFNEFLSQRKKQEAEERRVKLKKAREEFKQMLEGSTELTSSTRWSKVVSMFENDERFKAVERDRDRKDLFESYLEELKIKERARVEEERKRNRMEYREFLQSCDFIKADSQWRKLQDRLEADERCARLEKIDRLEIFLEYIRDLEREEEERRKIEKEELRKVERKNRDEFRKLMEEHIAAGTLTAKTHWRDYSTKVKDIPTYVAVTSNTSGSTPKELFQDVLEELEKQYDEDKTRIRDAVKLGKIMLSSTWTLEDFQTAISKDVHSPPVSNVNLKLVFDELLERVREKEEKEAKKRKRLADDFAHLLCSTKEIFASSKWEDCKPQFDNSREFSSIGEESFCREIFEQHIAQLKEQAKEQERKRKDEKAKKEKEREERERRKAKQRREKEEGREREKEEGREKEKDELFKKERADSKNVDVGDVHVYKESKRSGEESNKKQRKRHHSSEDNVDENEKVRSRKSHGSTSDHKKSRRHASAPESDNESRHKRHKRDHRNGSRRYGGHEELEDGEFGDNKQNLVDT